jgi:hypothetical protein
MQWPKTLAAELFGLFVDDGNFAVAIIVWLGVTWFLAEHVLARSQWTGAVLFVGLALILLESTLRRSRH